MELKTIKKTKKELELEVKDEDATILNPITERLLKDKDVDYASYISGHPEDRRKKLYIRIKKNKKTKPMDTLAKTVKELEKEIKNFSKDFKSQTKSKK